jgi:6-phosphogluconolactonase
MSDELFVYADAEMVAEEAKNLFMRLYSIAIDKIAIEEKTYFDVFLTGGSTPEKLYKKLATTPIEWKKIRLFIGDDRFVDITDPASNWGMIKRMLLDDINIPKENLFPMPSPSSGLSLEAAAGAYAKIVPENPDLILLGMGEDGHTASLFPGKPALFVTDRKVTTSPPGVLPPPVDRITLTFPAINSAKDIIILVTGEKKKEKLKMWRDETGAVETLPVLGISPVDGDMLIYCDKAAAGE